jgi:hypothetical protein
VLSSISSASLSADSRKSTIAARVCIRSNCASNRSRKIHHGKSCLAMGIVLPQRFSSIILCGNHLGGRSMLCGRLVLIFLAALISAKALADSAPSMQAPEARWDVACANAAAMLITPGSEEGHADELLNWIKLCNENPVPSVCRGTASVVERMVGKSPFSCPKSK